jgi:hypothetical protein
MNKNEIIFFKFKEYNKEENTKMNCYNNAITDVINCNYCGSGITSEGKGPTKPVFKISLESNDYRELERYIEKLEGILRENELTIAKLNGKNTELLKENTTLKGVNAEQEKRLNQIDSLARVSGNNNHKNNNTNRKDA